MSKVSVSARVDPRDLAVAALYISKNLVIRNKSDLIDSCVNTVAHIARTVGGINETELNEDSFLKLRALGIDWDGNEQAQKQILKGLQMDALSDLEPDQVEELTKYINDLRKRPKTVQQPTTSKVKSLIDGM